MTVDFDDNHYTEFRREDDHLVIWANPFPNEQPPAPSKSPEDFVFDSGATMTMITLDMAIKLGYDKLPVKRTAVLRGFVPGVHVKVDYKVLPGIAIAGLRLSKVTVAIPTENDPNADKIEKSFLGQNVLEYFIYCVDTPNDKIYFKKNPKPQPISEDAKCGIVFLADENMEL